jgi:hypothetical protein
MTAETSARIAADWVEEQPGVDWPGLWVWYRGSRAATVGASRAISAGPGVGSRFARKKKKVSDTMKDEVV